MTSTPNQEAGMQIKKLYAALALLDVPRSRTPLFENAVFAVLSGEPDKVVGRDADDDEVYAKQLLDAFGLNAADYDEEDQS